MEKKTRNTIGAVMMGTAMIVSTAPSMVAYAQTLQNDGATAPAAPGATVDATGTKAIEGQTESVVAGEFAYDQSTVTSNSVIKQFFSRIDQYMCGAQGSGAVTQPTDQWTLKVSGSVAKPFTATLAELGQKDELTVKMGCSCATNGANGRAVVNADVTGVSFETLCDMAAIKDEANTVTFISADGYQIALPLSYVSQRYTIIVYKINGETLDDSVGGTNQVWLGSTSARYFARDVVEIRLSHEQTPPPAPGSEAAGDMYANSPNSGVISGEAS